MTQDEIAAERKRFAEACPEFPQTKMAVFGDPQFMFSHTRVAERSWMKRAEIARAEQAELRAENERLISLLESLTTNPEVDLGDLVYEIREREGKGWDGPAVVHWSNAVTAIRTKLAEWRERMGGAG